MGGLTILITGAAGYLGRAAVAEAVTRGHQVRALVRSGEAVAGATVIRGDLNGPELVQACAGVDAVIHCAARLAGSEAELERDTVEGTRALMAAAHTAGVARVVLAGSMAVYGATGLRPGSVVDETTPLEAIPDKRDAYTRAKLAQEDVARAAGGPPVWILRLGAIWGPDRLWNGHLGVGLGPLLIRCGGAGEIPLLHRDHAARALVLAAETPPEAWCEVLNLTDSDLPDRRRYVRALQQSGWPRLVLPVGWRLLDAVAALGLAGMPGLLRRPTLRARMMPLRYSNLRAQARLGWQPWLTFDDAMARAVEASG